MQYVALLGRQPKLGLAELERVYSSDNVETFNSTTAIVSSPSFSIERLGGTLKAGVVIMTFQQIEWDELNKKIIQHYSTLWADHDRKQTLGISVYDWPDVSPKSILKLGLGIKNNLKKKNVSLRLVPNATAALSTATSHHNKLGLSPNKVELLIVRGTHGVVVAESTGAQNITAYARRDQARPKRDAFVGMLPPKLAQIMINLASLPQSSASSLVPIEHLQPETVKASGPLSFPKRSRSGANKSEEAIKKLTILDPFCGTGVILQEAALMGYDVYGTDLADKMIDYTTVNLDWLHNTHHVEFKSRLKQDDAMSANWQQPIDAVVCEGYLGQPFSAPPSPAKLREVVGNCNHIIGSFLKNIHPQLTASTPLCIAVPAWRDTRGNFTHLPLIQDLKKLGYERATFSNVEPESLLYYRTDQVVARELLVLTRK